MTVSENIRALSVFVPLSFRSIVQLFESLGPRLVGRYGRVVADLFAQLKILANELRNHIAHLVLGQKPIRNMVAEFVGYSILAAHGANRATPPQLPEMNSALSIIPGTR